MNPSMLLPPRDGEPPRPVLTVDPERWYCQATGVLVWAKVDGREGVVDISQLDRASLIAWARHVGADVVLRSVLTMLGHSGGPL